MCGIPLAALLLLTGATPLLAAGLLEGTTLVVVSGLPGDVESEQAYEDQLARLLQAASLPMAQPARIIALVDAPDRVKPAAGGASIRVEPASRERFLALSRELAALPGPLAVIVWGHAGMQGTRPVFHVRGPRIEPADFASFAATAGRRRSSWILYFRGSGAFAQALAGEGREVLSSDHDTAFRSDPVGLSLVLDSLRREPGLSLQDLATRVGRATALWYEEQHLARTEEPTLWNGAEPRHLAVGGAEAEQERPAQSPAPVANAQALASQGDWQGIERVAAERFPGANAVVLRRVHRYTIGDSPALAHEVDEFVQILTEEGESRADFDFSFWPPEERLALLDCEVQHPDGTVLRLAPDAVRDAAASAPAPEYPLAARRVLSLPGVTPGAVLRVHLRREWRRFPLPHVFFEVPLAEEIPVLSSSVEVRVGAGRSLHHAVSPADAAPAAGRPEISDSPHGRRYLWRIGETPAAPIEALAPPNREPRLLFSTFPDWASFADWYGRLIRLSDQVTPEIEAMAAALVKDKTTAREKVVALYDYVTSLRYVAVPLGVNSHRPHAAANVLQNRYGDCKDKANLFNTLLKTQGIPAELVLVPRFGEAHSSTPGLGFNHAISRVRIDGDWVFADTTDEFARFGLLPPGDPGRNVLVIDGTSKELVRLPDPRPEDHGIDLRGSVAPGGDARLDLTARGYADYSLRLAVRQTTGQGTTRPVLAKALQPVAGSFALTQQSSTAVSALKHDFEWHAQGTFSGLASDAGEAGRLVRAPFWLPTEWATALHARRTPLFLNQGYPLVLEESLELRLPPGARRVVLPATVVREELPLRYRVEWSRPGDDRVVAHARVEVARGELTSDETPAFQRQLRELLTAMAQGALYEAPPASR